MNGSVKLLLVDDHTVFLDALADRLDREPDMAVAARASHAEAAIRACDEFAPDVILMDINMPGTSCFDAVDRIRRAHPEIRIIFLSAYPNDVFIDRALKVKAHGYITKREPLPQVISAIREVAAGGAYFSKEVQSRIVVDSAGAKLRPEPRSIVSTLSRRELDVLLYVTRGLSQKEIAKHMNRSEKTVSGHISRLMKKLEIHDRVELTRFAIREGLAEA